MLPCSRTTCPTWHTTLIGQAGDVKMHTMRNHRKRKDPSRSSQPRSSASRTNSTTSTGGSSARKRRSKNGSGSSQARPQAPARRQIVDLTQPSPPREDTSQDETIARRMQEELARSVHGVECKLQRGHDMLHRSVSQLMRTAHRLHASSILRGDTLSGRIDNALRNPGPLAVHVDSPNLASLLGSMLRVPPASMPRARVRTRHPNEAKWIERLKAMEGRVVPEGTDPCMCCIDKRSTVLFGCSHVLMCAGCALSFIDKTDASGPLRCPSCNLPIESMYRYTPP